MKVIISCNTEEFEAIQKNILPIVERCSRITDLGNKVDREALIMSKIEDGERISSLYKKLKTRRTNYRTFYRDVQDLEKKGEVKLTRHTGNGGNYTEIRREK